MAGGTLARVSGLLWGLLIASVSAVAIIIAPLVSATVSGGLVSLATCASAALLIAWTAVQPGRAARGHRARPVKAESGGREIHRGPPRR